MIGRLSGRLAIKRAPQILIDCQGVGYDVDVSMSTYYQLPNEGESVSVWTHLLIKDDQHALVGFYTEQERKMFRLLIKVNGVGAKMALTILSGISERDFAVCILSSDVATLMRLPGVGKKTAERLIIEMRDKVQGLDSEHHAASSSGDNSLLLQASAQSEAIEALESLGYRSVDAHKMISSAVKSSADQSSEGLIKLALQKAIG
ncbi:MAG: Holliday junction branch migration protein RuvA [Chloroflexi bacterium]|nr:Holliday junction branch migration protein RuvA [Chloroflexota bacterium]